MFSLQFDEGHPLLDPARGVPGVARGMRPQAEGGRGGLRPLRRPFFPLQAALGVCYRPSPTLDCTGKILL